MPPKPLLLVGGETPLDIVETEFDELLTVDHDTGPVTPAIRWSIQRIVSQIIPHLADIRRNRDVLGSMNGRAGLQN
jgi:hypothetical protein